jgi:hypothetical protein
VGAPVRISIVGCIETRREISMAMRGGNAARPSVRKIAFGEQ